MLYHKTFYKESDVEAFIKTNFAKGENQKEEKNDDTEEEGVGDSANDNSSIP